MLTAAYQGEVSIYEKDYRALLRVLRAAAKFYETRDTFVANPTNIAALDKAVRSFERKEGEK